MALKQPYQSQSNRIATYEWSDLASGKSYQTFYGGYALTAGYFLSTTAVKSGYQQQWGDIGMTTTTGDLVSGVSKLIDVDFDTTFTTPQTIDGDCFINFTVGLAGRTGTAVQSEPWVVVQALKNGSHLVSGSTIAQPMALTATTANPHSHEEALNITIPKTIFAIGDTLRFTVEVWGGKTGGVNSGRLGLAHDGADRNDQVINAASGKTIEDADSTQLNFIVPFSTIDA